MRWASTRITQSRERPWQCQLGTQGEEPGSVVSEDSRIMSWNFLCVQCLFFYLRVFSFVKCCSAILVMLWEIQSQACMYDWNALIKQKVVISPYALPPRQQRGSRAARGNTVARDSGKSVHANPVEILVAPRVGSWN